MSFFRLPIEIRLAIYEELFGQGTTSIHGGRQDTGSESQTPTMLPMPDGRTQTQQRSAQILRTCKTIQAEASPILYTNTLFRTTFQAFAGRLPVQFTASHPSARNVRHLEWDLRCDLLKKYDATEFHITQKDSQALESVQINCQAASWREPVYGESCDRDALVRGRQYVVDFAKALQMNMKMGTRQVNLVEDVTSLSRGRVVIRLFRGFRTPTANVSMPHL